MGVISTVEDALLTKVQAVLGNTIKEGKTVQGGWTLDMLKRALQNAPGVYVAFLGGKPASEGYYNGKFVVYTVTKAPIETARRRGNQRVVGAYDMIEKLVPNLGGMTVPDVGTLKGGPIENLFRDAMFDLGGTVYGIALELPNMPLGYVADETAMDDFITFHADYDINQDGTVDAADELTNLNL